MVFQWKLIERHNISHSCMIPITYYNNEYKKKNIIVLY